MVERSIDEYEGAAAPPGRPWRWHPAWTVFGVAFLTLVAAAGFRSTPGVLFEPLEVEFGWGRGEVGSAVSVNLLLFGLAGPFAAALMGRFGLKRVVSTALLTISLGALGTTQMGSLWQFILLWGAVVGAGAGCMAAVFAATVANRWFVHRRGLITGALTAASASGQLLFLPLLSRMAEGIGWRWVSITIACAALAAVPLIVCGLHDKPEDIGAVAYGATPDHRTPPPRDKPIRTAFQGLRDARSTGAFWLLAGSFWVCGLSTNGLIQTHFIPAARDHGIDETSAASLLAMIGIFDVIGTVASGWLTDRIDPRRLLVAYYALRGLSLLVLHPALEARGPGLIGFMVFYGIDWVATVPPTVVLCTQVFGAAKGPIVFGWVFAAHQLGAALAAWGAGAMRDTVGSYQPAFVVAGLTCLAAAVGAGRIRTAPSPPASPTPSDAPTPAAPAPAPAPV